MRDKRVVIIIILVSVIVLLAGGGAAYYFLKMRSAKTSVATAQAKPRKKLFVSLKPLVVSIEEKGKFGMPSQSTYLQVGFQFETVHARALHAFKDLRPAIRGNVLALLLNVSPAVLHQQSARDKMKQNVLKAVNETLHENEPKVGQTAFGQVYITRFVTQAG